MCPSAMPHPAWNVGSTTPSRRESSGVSDVACRTLRVVRCVLRVACCVLHDPLGLRQAEASSGAPRAWSHASEDQPELHDALLDELLASADGACIDAAHMHRSMLPPDPSASSSIPTAPTETNSSNIECR